MKYVIVIESTNTGFSAYVPDLPGCISVGKTRREVEGYIQESIMLHIEGLKEDGEDQLLKVLAKMVHMCLPQVQKMKNLIN